jgi:hypothetical protein
MEKEGVATVKLTGTHSRLFFLGGGGAVEKKCGGGGGNKCSSTPAAVFGEMDELLEWLHSRVSN